MSVIGFESFKIFKPSMIHLLLSRSQNLLLSLSISQALQIRFLSSSSYFAAAHKSFSITTVHKQIQKEKNETQQTTKPNYKSLLICTNKQKKSILNFTNQFNI